MPEPIPTLRSVPAVLLENFLIPLYVYLKEYTYNIMAATKLTLRLEEEIIRQGKFYAKAKGTSLSKLVEQYLRELTADHETEKYEYWVEPDPFVRSLSLSEPTLGSEDDPLVDRLAYYNYLSGKTNR